MIACSRSAPGSGYAAAILSRIAAEVYTIERHEELAGRRRAPARMSSATRTSTFGTATARSGWPEHAPFDAIVVAAGGPRRARAAAGAARGRRPAGDSDRRDAARTGAGARHARQRRRLPARESRCGAFRPADRRRGLAGDAADHASRSRAPTRPRGRSRSSCAKRPSRSPTSTATRSTRSSSASATPGSSCSARRRTARPSSTACAPASRAS